MGSIENCPLNGLAKKYRPYHRRAKRYHYSLVNCCIWNGTGSGKCQSLVVWKLLGHLHSKTCRPPQMLCHFPSPKQLEGILQGCDVDFHAYVHTCTTLGQLVYILQKGIGNITIGSSSPFLREPTLQTHTHILHDKHHT